jgi:hypothetical protein
MNKFQMEAFLRGHARLDTEPGEVVRALRGTETNLKRAEVEGMYGAIRNTYKDGFSTAFMGRVWDLDSRAVKLAGDVLAAMDKAEVDDPRDVRDISSSLIALSRSPANCVEALRNLLDYLPEEDQVRFKEEIDMVYPSGSRDDD